MDCDGRYPEFLKSRGVWNLFVFPYNFAELSVYISWAFLVKFCFASVSIKKWIKRLVALQFLVTNQPVKSKRSQKLLFERIMFVKSRTYMILFSFYYMQLYCKDGSILPMFYQRDDMMALYDAIYNYVTKYVNLYYGKDINSQQLLIPNTDQLFSFFKSQNQRYKIIEQYSKLYNFTDLLFRVHDFNSF